jgi:membrane fusion protein, heavy metal efflux system
MFRYLSMYLSTFFTMAGLAAVGFVGHSTHWTFSFEHAEHNEAHSVDETAPHTTRKVDSVVRLKNDQAAKESGIQLAPLTRQKVAEEIEANGLIEFSPQHCVRVSSRTRGTLCRIEKQLGDAVMPGDILAIVEAPEIGNLKAELLRSLTQLRLRKAIVARFESVEDAIAEKQLLEARAAEREAHVDLLNAAQLLANHDADVNLKTLERLSESEAFEVIRYAGIPDSLRAKIAIDGANSSLVAITSPLGGVVIQRNCAAGETIDAGAMLFEVADPRQLVVKMDVRREGASKLAVGQKVNFIVDGHQGVGRAVINWIGVEVNEETRTVEARGKIEEFPEGILKANSFARCRVEAIHRNALLVPRSALHASEKNFYLFKQNSPTEFEAVRVERGIEQGSLVEVTGDLTEGDIIATEGSHALWSALVLQRLAE